MEVKVRSRREAGIGAAAEEQLLQATRKAADWATMMAMHGTRHTTRRHPAGGTRNPIGL